MNNMEWPVRVLVPSDRFINDRHPDHTLNAFVGSQLSDDFAPSIYSDGFRLAAKTLAKPLLDRGNSAEFPVDVAVFPIVFLYRHHFELMLKRAFVAGYRFIQEAKEAPNLHSLKTLWALVRPLTEQCAPEVDWSQNQIVTSLFDELHRFDPQGQAGRYVQDKQGRKHFQSIGMLNVGQFVDVADRLSDYLRDVVTGLEDMAERQEQYRYDTERDL